eukprot:TRINITY_DN44852_c0_g1_i1.p1 TRINITY_DN44852_c0_g1~~TRINITY_DN44852_c0_g1_i1.p1  ORF type:complete len:119 (-),score=11.33 TRINITY_DN44852_c0_g1_i1:55-411(-)
MSGKQYNSNSHTPSTQPVATQRQSVMCTSCGVVIGISQQIPVGFIDVGFAGQHSVLGSAQPTRPRGSPSPSVFVLELLLEDLSLTPSRVATMRHFRSCLLYTSPSPRDRTRSRMPSSV